jgi:hypothetical protein
MKIGCPDTVLVLTRARLKDNPWLVRINSHTGNPEAAQGLL